MKKKILAIILARSGSTRLKNKLFKKINGQSVLSIFYERLKMCKMIDEIILATSKKKADDRIVNFASRNGLKYFRGSEKNVLSRLVNSTKKAKINPDIIVRANADNTLIMPNIIDKEIHLFLKSKCDVSTPFYRNTSPFGMSLVIFKILTLYKILNKTKQKKYLEHIENYCFDNPKIFKIFRPIHASKFQFSNLKLSLDTLNDYKKIKFYFEKLKKISISKQAEYLVKFARKYEK